MAFRLSRLISYNAIPELVAENDADGVRLRRKNFERMSDTAGELGLKLWGNLNPINVPTGFLEKFPEAVGCASEGIDRSTRSLLDPPLCPRSAQEGNKLCEVVEIAVHQP